MSVTNLWGRSESYVFQITTEKYVQFNEKEQQLVTRIDEICKKANAPYSPTHMLQPVYESCTQTNKIVSYLDINCDNEKTITATLDGQI